VNPVQALPARVTFPRTSLVVAGAAGAAATFILAASDPLALGGFAAVCLVLAFAVRFSAHVPGLYLNLLGVVLAGYALFGRSVAYLGVPPLYIGEIMLALGLVALLMTMGALWPLLRLPQTWLIIALAAWGATQTVPYIDEYGIDALRDATVWGYGGYAIAVAGVVLAVGFRPIVTRYARAVPWLGVLVPLLFIARRLVGDSILMPGTDVPLLTNKMGDAGVHLAGAAAFVLAFGSATGAEPERSVRSTWMFWGTWIVALACVAGQNRGGFLSVVVALALVAFLSPRRIGRQIAVAAAGLLLAGGLVTLAATTIDPDGQLAAGSEERVASPRQIAANIASIVRPDADDTLTSTREWRLDWWRDISAYTVSGPYFWTGKGFGVNLADDDNFQVSEPGMAPLRSPHNVHMTFLARAGVPGLLLWFALNAAFGIGLVRAYARARRAGSREWAALNLWILAYWTAFLVNASFDVFLEGPQGGIWFWCVFGVGLAALTAQRAVWGVARDGARAG